MKNKFLYFVVFLLILFFLSPIGGRWAYLLGVRWIYILILSFLISFFSVPLIIQIAYKFKWLDYPDERKVHTTPLPRVGGVAVTLSLILTLVRNFRFEKEILGLILGAVIIFSISFLDDIYNIKASVRLIAQILASLIIISFGYRITIIPVGWFLEYELEIILTVLWIVGIVNAINFLDGIDGLVTSFGIFCGTIFLLISILTKQHFLGFIISALVGSCLGFLPYNWHKAKIFLGDCGATLIGYVLAVSSVVGTWAVNNPVVAISTPLLVLGVPIYDVVYTTVSRIKNGSVKNFVQWLEFVGKDHIHHRLLNLGFTVPSSVGIVILITLCLGLSAITVRFTEIGSIGTIALLLQSVAIFVLISVIMLSGRKKT